jgi:hypothetical protein
MVDHYDVYHTQGAMKDPNHIFSSDIQNAILKSSPSNPHGSNMVPFSASVPNQQMGGAFLNTSAFFLPKFDPNALINVPSSKSIAQTMVLSPMLAQPQSPRKEEQVHSPPQTSSIRKILLNLQRLRIIPTDPLVPIPRNNLYCLFLVERLLAPFFLNDLDDLVRPKNSRCACASACAGAGGVFEGAPGGHAGRGGHCEGLEGV